MIRVRTLVRDSRIPIQVDVRLGSEATGGEFEADIEHSCAAVSAFL
jgi:hypothetical protein